MRIFVTALVALNIALAAAAPQNNAEVARSEDGSAVGVVAERKGDPGTLLNGFQNDGEVIKICDGRSCKFSTVGEARKFERLDKVQALKEESEIAKALSPTFSTMSESLKGLQAQKALLEQLEAQMAQLTSASNKGQQLAEATKGQFAATMTKGLSFSPAADPFSKGQSAPSFDSKGANMFAGAGMSKGPSFAMPPSKGGMAQNPMALEAMMCPMTMYELGKAQKLANERKMQVDAASMMNANLMAEKQRLEASLAASEMLRDKYQKQSEFNAKYAAEEKSQKEMLANALAAMTEQKNNLEQQKAQLEEQLSATQDALAQERANGQQLTADLEVCNEESATLNATLQEETQRADTAEEELATTQANLEEETDARITCEETLSFTENRLNRSETDLAKERSTREQTEEELMKTMTDLASCQKEVRVTSEILSRTQDELQDKTASLARTEAARDALQQKVQDTVQQLRETEQEVRDTQRALEDEQNAHATTQRLFSDTQQELNATENARQALEEAKQQLEDELSETKNQLDGMTGERDQLQSTLNATSEALAQTTAEKMQCDSDLAAQNAISEQLSSQLGDALAMLKMEKEAREELTATIAMVQETSMKVQEEVKKLQVENMGLQAQVQKLQSEQQTALALAAGCPPTYEKFGSSCYKYVREKTPWKMAQEQCMKDSGNLVAIESTQEQIFLTNYLKRHGADDAYSFTSGNKQFNGWKWLGASDNHMGASGVEYWYNEATKMKPGYDCQAMYLYDPFKYGKWVGLPCYNSAPYVCEYNLLPPGAPALENAAEQMAILEMAKDAPPYLSSVVRY